MSNNGETIFAFQARYEDHFTRKLAAKDRELKRATRALRLEAAKLTETRARMQAARVAVESLREEYRGKGTCPAHYVAILAMLRVSRALDGGGGQ